MSRLARPQAVTTRTTTGGSTAPPALAGVGPRYRWIVLSNTLIASLIVSIDSTIVLISLPSIFRGIGVDPLGPGNTKYMLWMIMGFLIVTAVLVVSLGRLGDIYGRVRVYTLGFAVFTVFSILLSVSWMHGTAGADWLIIMRIGQGLGGAMLLGNASAIITDAFPAGRRGTALGIMNIGFVAGATIGLVIGGVLAPVSWRLIFLVSVPIGVIGTAWSYVSLRDLGEHHAAHIDWWGNLTFAAGLILVMIGVTYGIEPYQHQSMGWTSPPVLAALIVGTVLLTVFCLIEMKAPAPMFRLALFRIRAYVFGTLSSFLAALGRGGLMFMMVIWLQGIWLPLHGYSFATTPLWAGVYMMPLTAGFLLAGPVSGALSDHFGARPFATGGMLAASSSFFLLELLPISFSYALFAPLLLLNGLGMGAFASPNRAAVMNSLPPEHRGAGGGMNATFQSSAQVLSIGIFFTLVIVGLSGTLSSSLEQGLIVHGVPRALAAHAASLPPVSTLFAAFLGYNPMVHLLGAQTLAHLPHHTVTLLTGRSFFPRLISAPFAAGLHAAFDFSIGCCLIAAAASWSRGKRYVYRVKAVPAGGGGETLPVQDSR